MNHLERYRYPWPPQDFRPAPAWRREKAGFYLREMPERDEELALDSRWPAFFPSPMCLVTTAAGEHLGLEKVVGASIVNRFPYVVALSFCLKPLSKRHHVRRAFTDLLERGGEVAVQLLPPGEALDRAMAAVAEVPEEETGARLSRAGLALRRAETNVAPVFEDSYLVYEARLVRPGRDFSGAPIFAETPWADVGSHRLYFLEITAIQLREDIARGQSQIRWRGLPAWRPGALRGLDAPAERLADGRYQKGYSPHYAFPSPNTVAFEYEAVANGMALKRLPPLPEDQVEVDNDRARWPCFFPSSVGMITTWAGEGAPNLMPCGSTTVVSRHPFVIAPCVSYAAINERYAPRSTLELIRRAGRFGCGVPFIDDAVVDALRYAGTTSVAKDARKIANAGLVVEPHPAAPILPALPVHYDCEVTGEIRLGTHVMFLGEARSIRIRDDLTPTNPLEWCPWAGVSPAAP